jgi:hypothetical protein
VAARLSHGDELTRSRRTGILFVGTIVGALSIQALACSQGPVAEIAPSDAEQVQATFEAYRNAVAADEGAAAAEWVTEGTLRHAAELRDLALYATRDELESEPVGSEMHVLMFRLHANAEELQAMDGRDAFAFGVDGGLISNLWKAEDELRDLQIEGSGPALVAHRFRGPYKLEPPLRFVREADRWKLDVMPEFESLSAVTEDNAEEMNVPPRDLARTRIELYSMKVLEPRHLEPLRSRGTAEPELVRK